MKKNTLKKLLTGMFVIGFAVTHAQKTKRTVAEKLPDNYTPNLELQRAPTGEIKCATVEYNDMLNKYRKSPISVEDFERWIAPKIAEIKAARQAGKMPPMYTIPVVVHVIHNGDAVGSNENIADAQVLSQIQVFNEDFGNLAGTPGDGGEGVDTGIRFCMAQVDPSGNPTNGINRVDLGQASWDSMAAIDGTMKPATIWDPTKYLNMWTCNFGGGMSGTLGYAQFPTGSGLDGMPGGGCVAAEASSDGVVSAYSTFGSRTIYPAGNYSGTSYDKGRTMTHEVGHMLGLRHIWGDTAACTNDDFCADTPDSDASNFGCATTDSCPADGLGNDQTQNYMDYSDDSCMHMFTQDQADRMVAVLLNADRRIGLLNSTVCNPIPSIQYTGAACETSMVSLAEPNGCGAFQDVNIDVEIDMGASQNTDVTFSVNPSSTAVEGSDFIILTPSVTFNAGSMTTQTLTVRVFNSDAIGSGARQAIIDFVVNANGGDAIANTDRDSYTIDVAYDIVSVPNMNNGAVTLFSDDFESHNAFEIGNVGGWTFNDVDGSGTYGEGGAFDWPNQYYSGAFITFDPSQVTGGTLPANWNPHGGNMGYYCFNATAPGNDDYIFTPQLNLGTSSQFTFWAKTLDNTWGEERFRVGVSTTDTNPASFTFITPNPYQETTTSWVQYSYDLSAYDNQTVYLTINCVSNDAYVFMIDDVAVTTNATVNVQVDDNTGAPATTSLGSGTQYFLDPTTNDFMSGITVNDASNYGCTDVAVSRDIATAGAPAVMYQTAGAANFVMAKTYTISPSTINAAGNSDITFYFTEAEIAAWEAATGNLRTELAIIKGNTGIPATIGSLGNTTGVSLTATFSDGLDGTYYFGKLSSLGVAENQFEVFGVYPNPSNGEVTLTLSANEDVTVSLFDIRGRKVYAKLNQNNSDVFTTKLNFSGMASGVYMLDVQSGSKRAVQKLVIK